MKIVKQLAPKFSQKVLKHSFIFKLSIVINVEMKLHFKASPLVQNHRTTVPSFLVKNTTMLI